MRLIEAAAAERPKIGLDDALAILIVLAQANDPRFDRAAARWVGRLLTKTSAGLADAHFGLALSSVCRAVGRLCTGWLVDGELPPMYDASGGAENAPEDRQNSTPHNHPYVNLDLR